MSATLTCWKDIANYLGKGVRTVQRWERESGLPVKRPSTRHKGMVFAIPEELDEWIMRQSGANGHEDTESELVRLRAEVARLSSENEILRHELQTQSTEPARNSSNNDNELMWYRCAVLLAANKVQRDQCVELVTISRVLRNWRRQPPPEFSPLFRAG